MNLYYTDNTYSRKVSISCSTMAPTMSIGITAVKYIVKKKEKKEKRDIDFHENGDYCVHVSTVSVSGMTTTSPVGSLTTATHGSNQTAQHIVQYSATRTAVPQDAAEVSWVVDSSSAHTGPVHPIDVLLG